MSLCGTNNLGTTSLKHDRTIGQMDSHPQISTLQDEIIFLLVDYARNTVCRLRNRRWGMRPHAEVQFSRVQHLKAHQCLTTTRICHVHQYTGACCLPRRHSIEGMPHTDVKGVGPFHEALPGRRARFNIIRDTCTSMKGTEGGNPTITLSFPRCKGGRSRT